MKWMLGRNVAHRGATSKSDVKQFPFDNLSGAAPVCQRSYSDASTTGLQEDTSTAGFARVHKVIVMGPDEETVSPVRMMHNRAKRKAYIVTFPFPVWNEYGSITGWPGMSETVGQINEGEAAGIYYGEVREITPADCGLPDDGMVVDTATDASHPYQIQYCCSRVLVFEGMAHDGTEYPDAVLRAPLGTAPPDGPKWRMRRKPSHAPAYVVPASSRTPVPDSDTRFEPFFYPASGCSYPRFLAEHWDSETPVILSGNTPSGTWCFGHVGDQADLEAKLDGTNILCRAKSERANFLDEVPAGIRHTLVLECDVYWIRKKVAGVVTRRICLFGIFGRAVMIV